MKARVKATGEIVEVYPSIHKGCDYDGSDGYSYVKEDIIILDDDPDYWTRLEHQAAIAAMGGICGNTNYDETSWGDMAVDAIWAAHTLVKKLKVKEERK
jgi:hypothetical protein